MKKIKHKRIVFADNIGNIARFYSDGELHSAAETVYFVDGSIERLFIHHKELLPEEHQELLFEIGYFMEGVMGEQI